LQQNIQEAKAINEERERIIRESQFVSADIRQNASITQRFEVLKKQYQSDIDRLEFIVEAKILSDQLGDTVCPICNSPIDDNHIKHINENKEFIESALVELEKSKSKLIGLNQTLEIQNQEYNDLVAKLDTLNEGLKTVEEQIARNFSAKIKDLKNNLKEYVEVESTLNEIKFVDKQVTSLVNEKARFEKLLETKTKAEEVTLISTQLLAELSDFISRRLTRWNYEPFISVDFDSSHAIFDIIISGKPRNSYGKGKRAISYMASILGLLDYCLEHRRSFINTVVVDSPLTTFKEKRHKVSDSGDVVEPEIISSFFLDIANTPRSSQIIIFDNQTPSQETRVQIGERIFIQEFTGDPETGRPGFFPV